jgi:hypothetical protein
MSLRSEMYHTAHWLRRGGGGFNTVRTRQLALPRICVHRQAGCWQHRRCQLLRRRDIMLTLAKSTELAALIKPLPICGPLGPFVRTLRLSRQRPPVQCTAGHRQQLKLHFLLLLGPCWSSALLLAAAGMRRILSWGTHAAMRTAVILLVILLSSPPPLRALHSMATSSVCTLA